MAYLNYIALIGNLTRNPELRYTQRGTPICDFGLALSRKTKTAVGQERDETVFIEVSRIGKGAENLPRYICKGSPVLVTGSLKMEVWQTRESGEKRTRISVLADRVQFLNAPRKDEEKSNAQPNQGGIADDDIPF